MHYVIFVPGLGDNAREVRWGTSHWRRHGLTPVIFPVGWRDDEKEFTPKLERIIHLVNKLSLKGNTVSIVGISAGGSAAINTFYLSRPKVSKVINVCGRLRNPIESPSLPFNQSVALCEKNLVKLTLKDKQNIMTVRAKFGDQLVPGNTSIISGARNIELPTIEHVFSITMALTLFSRLLIYFLKEQD